MIKRVLLCAVLIVALIFSALAWDFSSGKLTDETDGTTWRIKGTSEADTSQELDAKYFKSFSLQYKGARAIAAQDSLDFYLVLLKSIAPGSGWIRSESVLVSDTLWHNYHFKDTVRAMKVMITAHGATGNDTDSSSQLQSWYFFQE